MGQQEGTSDSDGYLGVTVARRGDLFAADCPTRLLLDRVGSKWSVMIVLLLADAPELRFGMLMRQMGGVSQKMLSETLRRLAADGLVRRRVEATSPPSVHYSLTPLGTSLVPPLRELKRWAEESIAAVEAAWTPSTAVSDG